MSRPSPAQAVARQMLESTNWNLESAINLHFTMDGGMGGGGGGGGMGGGGGGGGGGGAHAPAPETWGGSSSSQHDADAALAASLAAEQAPSRCCPTPCRCPPPAFRSRSSQPHWSIPHFMNAHLSLRSPWGGRLRSPQVRAPIAHKEDTLFDSSASRTVPPRPARVNVLCVD